MARPKVESKYLASAIAWERTRAKILESWGYDVSEIKALADNYARKLMDLDEAADSQQFSDVSQSWSADSPNQSEAA